MDNELISAQDAAQAAIDDLSAALAQSTPVEALVLYPLIAKARELADGIKALQVARNA